ncbi:alpha/beta hydrolase [Terrimonas sp. NA20]|uniref:Alpha/beta hydrolase n=1 Tax=Terrimonas ginsenosidimutans TaxID=2908004 RepID=A0ABS9KQJ7_9BACT|nr:alpha/beta hydrolase [Terrimonas ginsenosidimutans]MCG2614578.1 alpha/beta hydrolase [Terrimonas ginsenosidimutans]
MASCDNSQADYSFVAVKPSQTRYSSVNGLPMYYEIYGKGDPLVLIHGGGSTIGTTFGRVLPQLAQSRQLIAVELQAHGRTSDRDADLSFEQDADDVAALLHTMGIVKADFFGFSNGGTTVLQIAIRHPQLVNALILGSALAKRDGAPEGFWEFMDQAQIEQMPEQLKEAYRDVAPDTNGLQIMHDRDVKRMVNFKDIPDSALSGIQSPALIMIGDKDMILPEHAVWLSRLIPNARLAIIPGGHGEYIGEITTLKQPEKKDWVGAKLVEEFLDGLKQRSNQQH